MGTPRKPIPVADRAELWEVAGFLEELAGELSDELSPSQRADRYDAILNRARHVRRIACRARSIHKNLAPDARCAGCGATRAEDEVSA